MRDLIRFQPFRTADGAGGGAAAADAGTDPGAAAAAAAAVAGAGDPAAGAADASAQPAPKWWEAGALSDAQRQHITVKGLTVDDPVEAIAKLADMHKHAETRLGVPADQLVAKPKQGETVEAWMKSQAKLFGLPEAPEGYDLKPALAALPKDVPFDSALDGAVRKAAFEAGVTPAQLQAVVGAYVGRLGDELSAAQTQMDTARTEMMTQLQADWGDQTPGRIGAAKGAFQALAAKAGLDAGGLAEALGAFEVKGGSANLIRLGHALAEMMGEDMLAGGGQTGGGGMAMTPADARQKLAQLREPGGAYYEASAKGDSTAIRRLQPEIERLTRIASGSK